MRRGARDRTGVGTFADVSEVARRRWKAGRYRPAPLAGFAKDLDAWVDPAPPA